MPAGREVAAFVMSGEGNTPFCENEIKDYLLAGPDPQSTALKTESR